MVYAGTDLWLSDISEAIEHWVVKDDEQQDGSRYVRAEADTGTTYIVVITHLGQEAEGRLGGPTLVTVCQPWQDSWPLQNDGPLTASYVSQHLCSDRTRLDHLNGGDLAALTLTVAYALGRKPFFDTDQ